MKKIIFIIFAISLFHQPAVCQWVTQNSGTTQHLYDVYFINTQTGWVCGNNGTLLKTINGGSNWFVQNSGINDRPLNSIQFVNTETGWNCSSLFNIAGTINKTIDGGDNWITQYSTPNKSFLSLFFINTLTGWAGSSGSGGYIYHTNNGGNSWDSLSLILGGATIRDIEFINTQTGWLAMGGIYKTTDNGENWFLQYLPNAGEIQSLSFPSENIGYAVSLESWRIYRTTNSGDTWEILTTLPVCFDSECIFFSNNNTGWVSGGCGQMFSTTNGGLNWFQQQTNTNSFLQSVQFVNDSTGWCIGGGGKIIYTSNGGAIIGIEPSFNNEPTEYKLYQNYPNPFNPTTSIKFELPQNTFVTLKIYNAIGEEVAILANNEYKNAGRYSVNFDGSQLASGIYFYSIEAGMYKDVKKMVLIK